MAKLVVTLDGKPYRELQLQDGKDVAIGADQSDDLRLEHAQVSTRHAELRWRDGQWVIFDLASESGVFVDGQRSIEAVLGPGVTAAIGPFRLTIDTGVPLPNTVPRPPAAESAALSDTPTLVAGEVAPAAPVGTVTLRPGSAAPPAPSPAGPAATPSRTRRTAAVAPKKAESAGLIAKLAALPKPVLFGGFALLMVVLIGLKALTSPGEQPSSGPSNGGPQQAVPDNRQVVTKHLGAARERMKRGDYEGLLKENIEPVLLIDKTNADALALKAEAEEKLAKAPPAEPAPVDVGVADAAAKAAPSGEAAREMSPEAHMAARAAAVTRAGGSKTPTAHQMAGGDAPHAVDPRLAAQAAFDAALVLQDKEQWLKAQTELDRACAMPQAPSACGDAKVQLAERIKSEAADALRRAKMFDAQGRLPEAIALYQRAVDLMTPDDANRKAAEERLTYLKSRR